MRNNVESPRFNLYDEVQNTLLAGVIRNFEMVYELGFKMLRRQIEAESASPDEVDAFNFRDIFRAGAEKGWIADAHASWAALEARHA